MHRRNFIILSTFTTAITSIPFINCSYQVTELDKNAALPETLSQLLDAKSMKQIGKEYGKINPGEYDIKSLEKQLLKDKSNQETSVKEVAALLAKNVQQDFNTGNTIVLSGWVLSLTEARQCALFSLISK